MSAWESKAAGPVWRSRGGEDRRTVPELSCLYYDLLRPTMSQYEGASSSSIRTLHQHSRVQELAEKKEVKTDDMDPSFHSQELTDLCATLQIRLEATLDLTATHHRRLHTTEVYTLGQIRTESHKEHMTQRL
ncbi:unnamed protein product [Pleuronectes platessa]|uniref:Uncharacterized protein n=1 Tax=Pleuronectes platessa TaxID=8262 RepID=A0A9N7YDC0_PLEPL|nr:unnamed protein product [Pleuronectes platessa]